MPTQDNEYLDWQVSRIEVVTRMIEHFEGDSNGGSSNFLFRQFLLLPSQQPTVYKQS